MMGIVSLVTRASLTLGPASSGVCCVVRGPTKTSGAQLPVYRAILASIKMSMLRVSPSRTAMLHNISNLLTVTIKKVKKNFLMIILYIS